MDIHSYINIHFRVIKNKVRAVTKGNQNTDDLIQDLIINLLEKGDEYCQQLVDDGKVDHYIVRMAYIQFNSSSSPYYYKYRKVQLKSSVFDTDKHGGEYEQKEIKETDLPNKIREEINQMHWYDRTLATDHFVNGKSMRQMSREYGINRSYISKDLKRIKNIIVEKYDGIFSDLDD